VFPPYDALAGELILCNEAGKECGGLAQGFFCHSGAARLRANPESSSALPRNDETR
jgi:hypothetical protein